MKKLRAGVTCITLMLTLSSAGFAEANGTQRHWNQFRGPQGDGTATQARLPTEFGEAKNVRWKTAIHDEGWSSPVVWGDQVWVTTGRKDGSELFALCVDLTTGKVVHDIKVFEVSEPQAAYDGYNTHATPTPIVEEGRIYVHFGAYGTACLDTRTGARLWERRELQCDHRVRPASSPIMDGDLLFLVYDGVDVQFIAALDKKTGATRWQRERKSGVDFEATLKAAGITDTKGTAKKKPNDNRKAYATPTILEHQGKKQLVSPAAEVTISYDPATGEELWRVRHEGWGWNSACRPIYDNGLVYVITGFARQLLAIRPDGTGDVTDTRVVWKTRKGVPSISSPVIAEGLLFMVDDQGGIVSCLDAKTGVELGKERLGYGSRHWASPLSADGKVYFFSKEGDVTEIASAREFRVLANHQFDEGFTAGPAIVGNALILRSASHLYCVADDGTAPGGEGNATNASIAATISRAISENRTGQFIEARFVSDQGGALPLQIFIPANPAKGTRYPLLVFLHGAGELGDDNLQQLAGFPRVFVSPENQAKHPCYVIAPQCPKSDAWSSFPEYPANARSSASPTVATRIAIELVEKLIAECNIDPARVYVTGLSFGGEGTFDIVSRRPDLFAAAVPICGIADVEKASRMASVPFWIFHGDRDEINPVKYSREAFQALKANGATPIYTEYQDAGHDIWGRAYSDPGLIPWLFRQYKGPLL